MAGVKAGQKGHDLEETLKSYFWQAGYFAIRGLPYRLDDEDITDVDLWLYERPAALTRRRLILDAKNKKIPKAVERIVWVKGLQSALGVDGALVASTDRRQSSRKLARSVGVTLLDGNALAKLSSSDKLRSSDRLSSEDFDGLFKSVDVARRGNEWRNALLSARVAVLSNFGVNSANSALRTAGFFAEQAVQAAPESTQASTALRGFYSACALTAIGLDYAASDLSFKSSDERREALVNGVRYGQIDSAEALSALRAAIAIVRQHAPNGNSIAKQIERDFHQSASEIRADIIAEFVSRVPTADSLFSVARELEQSAYRVNLPSFDQLSIDGRSLVGVFLDFHDISRERLAKAVPPHSEVNRQGRGPETIDGKLSLFPDDTGSGQSNT